MQAAHGQIYARSASQSVNRRTNTHLLRSFFHTGQRSSNATTSGLGGRDNCSGNAGDIGDYFCALQDATAVGKDGEFDGRGDLFVVAASDSVGSGAGEGREGGDEDS
jgi:hypothetical protein